MVQIQLTLYSKPFDVTFELQHSYPFFGIKYEYLAFQDPLRIYKSKIVMDD